MDGRDARGELHRLNFLNLVLLVCKRSGEVSEC